MISSTATRRRAGARNRRGAVKALAIGRIYSVVLGDGPEDVAIVRDGRMVTELRPGPEVDSFLTSVIGAAPSLVDALCFDVLGEDDE